MIRQISAGFQSMNGLSLNMFTEHDLEEIHQSALEVLSQCGMYVESKAARDLFKSGGAVVNDDTRMVKLPAYMVEEAIKRAPSSFVLYGRDSAKDVVMGRDYVNFCNFGEAIMILDPYTGAYRETAYDDVAGLVKFIDAMDEIDFCFSNSVSRDSPPQLNNIHCAEAALVNTAKPVLVSPENTQTAEILIAMSEAAAGSAEALRLRPMVMGGGCPQSPLMYSEGLCESIMAFAKAGLPFMVLSMAMSGGSAPVTLAGTLITHNAEVLTGIVLGQLVNPGAPQVYGSSTTAMDLRSGTASVGSPELALLSAGAAALANRYQIPSLVAGG